MSNNRPRRFRTWRHKGKLVYATAGERYFQPGKASIKRIQRLIEKCDQAVYFTARRQPVFWYTLKTWQGD